jgi:IS5 family transposase
VICDGQGIPLAATLTAANRNDITELIPLVDRVPPTERHGKFRPKTLLADRAYDSRKHRNQLRERGIVPRIAKRNTTHGSGLGKERWVIERVRHEALLNREEVRGLFLWAVAAAR